MVFFVLLAVYCLSEKLQSLKYPLSFDSRYGCNPNCIKCPNQGVCVECQEEYYLSDNNECLECSPGCCECNDANSCVSCTNGYFLEENKCIRHQGKCSEEENCSACESSNVCISCEAGFWLSEGKCYDCQVFSEVNWCLDCESSTRCNKCVSGYEPNKDGVCLPKQSDRILIDTLFYCEEWDGVLCTKCQEGYTVQQEVGKCVYSTNNNEFPMHNGRRQADDPWWLPLVIIIAVFTILGTFAIPICAICCLVCVGIRQSNRVRRREEERNEEKKKKEELELEKCRKKEAEEKQKQKQIQKQIDAEYLMIEEPRVKQDYEEREMSLMKVINEQVKPKQEDLNLYQELKKNGFIEVKTLDLGGKVYEGETYEGQIFGFGQMSWEKDEEGVLLQQGFFGRQQNLFIGVGYKSGGLILQVNHPSLKQTWRNGTVVYSTPINDKKMWKRFIDTKDGVVMMEGEIDTTGELVGFGMRNRGKQVGYFMFDELHGLGVSNEDEGRFEENKLVGRQATLIKEQFNKLSELYSPYIKDFEINVEDQLESMGIEAKIRSYKVKKMFRDNEKRLEEEKKKKAEEKKREKEKEKEKERKEMERDEKMLLRLSKITRANAAPVSTQNNDLTVKDGVEVAKGAMELGKGVIDIVGIFAG